MNIASILVSFFQGASGKSSWMRLMSGYVVFSVMTAWLVISIRTGELVNLPETMVWIVGIAIAGKVVQRPMEKDSIKSPTTP
jgi:hypothetical protein